MVVMVASSVAMVVSEVAVVASRVAVVASGVAVVASEALVMVLYVGMVKVAVVMPLGVVLILAMRRSTSCPREPEVVVGMTR